MAGSEGHESVDRALRVIEVLGTSGSGFTLEELAAATGIPKSTLHRTLTALKRRGFAAQPRAGGPYTLGVELLSVAFGFYERLDVRSLVHPLLVRARDAFDETVHMAVLDGGDVVYLDKVESRHPLKMSSVIGGRNPAHATAIGKALLAWALPGEKALSAWIAEHGPLVARTPNTVVDGAALAAELAAVRERGWALESEESELGVRCVAAPVFLGREVPAAAVSVAGPTQRLTAAQARAAGPQLRALADAAFAPAT
jgi:IclR family transcriptional regulator, acetate operon repressor